MKKYRAREVEIWRMIKQSDSVVIGVDWKLEKFSKKLCNYLLTAKKITTSITGNSKRYDWRPDLVGCSDTNYKSYERLNEILEEEGVRL